MYVLRQFYSSTAILYLDFGDIIYDQPNSQSFSNKLESIQYNAALAINGVIRGTSKTKLYKELGLEYLKCRRWFRSLCILYKIKTCNISPYMAQLPPKDNRS